MEHLMMSDEKAIEMFKNMGYQIVYIPMVEYPIGHDGREVIFERMTIFNALDKLHRDNQLQQLLSK